MADIKVKIDRLGRIVIPVRYRKSLGIDADSTLLMQLFENALVIRPEKKLCHVCKSEKDLLDPYNLCRSCAEELTQRLALTQSDP